MRECARIQTFPDNFTFESDDIKATYKMIGNAVPPRMANELAKSIFAALKNGLTKNHLTQMQESSSMDSTVLVGYYKDEEHHDLVLKHRLYYVRSDGRTGSLLRQDCAITPRHLLLHHKDKAEIYELDGDEPVLVNGTYLKSLGFSCLGDTYLCFKLKDIQSRTITELGGNRKCPQYNKNYYFPYFTTLEKLINEG